MVQLLFNSKQKLHLGILIYAIKYQIKPTKKMEKKQRNNNTYHGLGYLGLESHRREGCIHDFSHLVKPSFSLLLGGQKTSYFGEKPRP